MTKECQEHERGKVKNRQRMRVGWKFEEVVMKGSGVGLMMNDRQIEMSARGEV